MQNTDLKDLNLQRKDMQSCKSETISQLCFRLEMSLDLD